MASSRWLSSWTTFSCFPAESRNSIGNKLRPSSIRCPSLLIRSRIVLCSFVVIRAFMAGAASQAGDADSSRAPGLTSALQGPWIPTVVLYCWCHSDSASVLLYFYIDEKKQLTVNRQYVTISISILQTFRFWVAMYHLHPPMAFFILQLIRYARACSSYECFILRTMRLSNKLLGQGYVKERLRSSLRKFYGRYGDFTKQYEVPLSRMLHDILDDGPHTVTPSIDRTLHQFLTITDLHLITEFDFLPYFARFPQNICNGCDTEDAYSSGHLVLSHFGTCMCSNVETNLSWTCLVSGLVNFEHPSVLLFC